MKTKIIVLLSVLIFALGIFCACGGNNDSASTGDSVSVSESVSASESAKDSESASESEKESDSVKDSESAHTHNFVFESWVTAPGLETAGKAKMKCECDEEKEEDVPALSDATVWTLTADVADPCVGGEAEYSSEKYGKVKVEVAAKHELGELVPAKAATCKEEGNVAYRQCAKCKKYFGEDGAELATIIVAKVAHTPADAIRENEVAATCTAAGSYDEVVKCSVCGEEISRETKTIEALGHTPKAAVQENVVNATCTVPGSYDSVVYCSVCNAEISREHVTGKTVPHTPAAAVRENEHPATCKAEGSYEEVIKCSVCGTEISRTTKTIAKLAHTPADAVRENEHPATCTEAGSYDEVVECSVCGEEISRVTKSIDALGHTPAAAVRENEVAATCYAAGSYDEVVRCSVCNEEISKESKTTAIVDHNFVNGKCDMCGLAVKYAGVQFISGNDYSTKYSKLFAFNAKGVAEDGGIYTSSRYSDSMVTFKWVDFAAGKLTLTVNYNYISSSSTDEDYGWGSSGETKEEKEAIYKGFFDKATGAFLVGSGDTIGNGFILLIPSDVVVENAPVSSQLGGKSAIKAVSVTLGETVHSVFVKNGEVFFDVSFTDVQGNAVAASELNPNKYADGFTFVVKKGDDVVAAYGVKDGTMEALDSVFGSYTSGDDTLVLDGLGKATLGEKVGTYVVNGGVVEIKVVVDGKVAEYYEVVLDGAAYTIDKPMVTVSFDLGADHGTKAAIQVNKHVDFALAGIKLEDTATEVFAGWYINDELVAADAYYVFTSDVTLTANWVAKVAVKITDEIKGDEIIYAGAGENLLEVLAAHDVSHETKVFEKYQYKEGEELFNIAEDAVVPDDVTEIEIVAKYFEDVEIGVHPGLSFGDVVANITKNANVKDYLNEHYAYTSCVDGYKFDGWFLNSDHTVELADDKLADATMEVYGKWSWAGNVKFTEQKSYPFAYVSEKNAWKSTNEGHGSTSSVLEIVVTSGVANIEFDYWITSENGYDYATIYYYVDGVRKELKTKGKDIAEANAQHLSTTLTYTGETDISLRIGYSKDGSGNKGLDAVYIANLKINGVAVFAQAPLNPDAVGEFVAADNTVVKLTAGGGATVGDETVAYTTISENVIGVNLAAGYREITLDKENHTCVIAIPQVSVTYNYGGHGDNTTTDVEKNSTQTVISDVPTADGFIFRGWYKEETFVTKMNAGSTFTADSDITFYAKWDKAITVTYKYEDDGAHADEVADMYANDKITLKTVDFDFDGKVFVGWYTKNAAGEYADKVADNAVMTDDAVLYAKWVEAPKSVGSYKGWNLYRDPESGTKAADSLTSEIIVISADGTFKIGSNTGSLTAEQAAVTDGSMVLGGSYVYFNKELGLMWKAYGNNASGVGNDTYLCFNTDVIASVEYSGFKGTAGSYIAYISVTLKDGSVKTAFLYNSKVVANATWGDGVSAKDANSADRLVSKNGAPIAKVVGKSIIGNDGLGGTFTCDAGVYVLNGFGDVTFTATGAEAVTGTYKSLGDNVFGITLADGYKEITVNREDGTCVVAVPQVTISYNYGGHGEDTSAQVDKNSQQTVLAEEPVAEGFKFRAWYKDEEFKNKVTAGSKFTASADITFYAKWDEAITVTFKFEDEGEHEDVIVNMYANDKITLQKVDFSYNGLTFVGWYTMSDAGDLDQKIAEGDEITATVILYAKWIEAPQSYGTYKGWNLYGKKTSSTESSFSKEVLTVNVDGTYKYGSTNGTLTDEQCAITDGSMVLSGTYYYFNKELGLVWRKYGGGNAEGVTTDTDLGVDVSKVSSIAYTGRSDIAGSYVAYLVITYKDKTTKTAFLYNSKIVANATLEGAEATNITGKDFVVKVNDAIVVKIAGKAFLENDGLGGTYAGDYGEIVVSGFGSLTVGGVEVDYTVIAERTIKFVAANSMKEVLVDLGNGTYAKVLDGYEGTYTLPDGSTVTLDGFGGAGDGKTYVVSGSNITIYDGETSATYGLDVENKQLLGKSIFAGLTFSGNYLDAYGESSAFKIVFDDSPSISGYLSTNSDGLRVKFTAVLDGTTLTATVLSANSISWSGAAFKSDSAFDGKVVVMTVDGDTLKVTSTSISNNAYTFKSGTAKCDGFSL